MKTLKNTVLCDTLIEPDGAVVVIEDVGARGIPGAHVHPDVEVEPSVPWHALWAHTMSADECAVAGRPVRVRVIVGSDGVGLGDAAFEGCLEVASGVLAIGDAHNPGRRLLFGSPTSLRLSIYVKHVIEVLRFPGDDGAYPASGPSDVTVLLHGDPGLAPAIGNTVARTSWLRWPRLRRQVSAAGHRSCMTDPR